MAVAGEADDPSGEIVIHLFADDKRPATKGRRQKTCPAVVLQS